MALGVSQISSWATSGWANRSFLVRFSYAFRALLKISQKLDDGAEVS